MGLDEVGKETALPAKVLPQTMEELYASAHQGILNFIFLFLFVTFQFLVPRRREAV